MHRKLLTVVSMFSLAASVAAYGAAGKLPDTHDAQANRILAEHPAIVADLLKADQAALRCHTGHFPPPALTCTATEFTALRADLAEVTKFNLFMATYEVRLGMQLDQCGSYEIAGDESAAYTCRLETINAADYLVFFGIGSHNPPMIIWLGCGMAGEASIVTQARCMVAAGNMEVCAFYPDGKLAHDTECRMMLLHGNWEANPKAREMRFDNPHPMVKHGH
jgi:hypothetical protein